MTVHDMTAPALRAASPQESVAHVPVHDCTSPEVYALERERIFRRTWLNVGHVSDAPAPGDYTLRSLPTLGAEVILARGRDDRLRAFWNVCPHRGNKLVREPSQGNAGGFSCNFHGWTFDLEGRLRVLPDQDEFPGLDPCHYGLREVPLDTWENFVFVHPEGSPRQSLRAWLGPVADNLAGGPLAGLVPSAVFRATVRVNWKVFFDAFCEGYHVATIHRRSIADAFIGKDNPYCHLAAVRLYEHHHMASIVGGNPDHQPTLAERLVARYGGSKYGVPSVELFDQLPAGLNPERHPAWAFDIVDVFPNFALHVGAHFCYTYNFWPTASGETQWEMRLYQPLPRNHAEVIARQYTAVVLRDTVREDVNTTEATQQNLAAGLLEAFTFGRQEALLAHRYQVVRRFLGEVTNV